MTSTRAKPASKKRKRGQEAPTVFKSNSTKRKEAGQQIDELENRARNFVGEPERLV